MGVQFEHLKEVESIILKFSTPDYVRDYLNLKEIDRQIILEKAKWSPTEALGKFTAQEKAFNDALKKSFSGITESEKEFGGNIVEKSFTYISMAIKPMLEIDVLYSSFQRTYPEEKLIRRT